MKRSADDFKNGSIIKTNICIVGAGAAGITLARALIGKNLKVTLLEAGGYDHTNASQDFYKGAGVASSPRELLSTEYPLVSRLRYFGGATNHWGGWTRPLDAIDFEKRPWVRDSGWPIGRQALVPYYSEAARLVEIEAFNLVNEDQSFRYPEEPTHGSFFPKPSPSPEIVTRHFYISPPTRFGEKYRNELEGAANVEVLLNSNVIRFDCRPGENKIQQVVLLNQKNQSIRVQADQFVLACGGLENPRLLLNSNHQFKNGLGNQSGKVGRYFMEHPHTSFGSFINLKDKAWLKTYEDFEEKFPKRIFATSAAFQKQYQTMNFCCEIGKVSKAPKDSPEVLNLLKGLGTDLSKVSFAHLFARTEMEPQYQNRVELSEERDSVGLRKMKIHLVYSEKDRQTIKKSTEAAIRYLAFQGYGRGRLNIESESDWSTDITVGHHHMGTTRMSHRPKDGVVDSNCKVHGISNLYIGGSSVFTTGGYANPTLTIIALALRLADHLSKRRLR